RFVNRWREDDSYIYQRLWASLVTDPVLASAADVAEGLLELPTILFWDVHEAPEIAVLRARRFSEFKNDHQARILRRLRNLPPRRIWGARVSADDVAARQLYWTIRELKRIEGAGGVLPIKVANWVDEHVASF